MRRKTSGVLGSLAVFASLLAACGGQSEPPGEVASGGFDSLVTAAKNEGTLTWYTGSEQSSADLMAEQFKSEYGITVDVVRLTSGPIAQRVATEVTSNSIVADVVSTVDDVFFKTSASKGWFVPMAADQVPEIAAWPEQFKKPDYVTFAVGAQGVGYNTNLVTGEPPCTWDAVLDPRFAGKVILTDPASSAAYTNFYSAVLEAPNLGESFLRRIKDLGIVSVADSAVPGAQLLGAGEGAITLPTTSAAIDGVGSKGAPVKSCVLENPSPVYEQYMGVVKGSKHPNAALLFLDFMLTKDAQTAYSVKAQTSSPLGDLPGAPPLPKGLVQPDTDKAKANLPKIQEILSVS